jgi:ribonuclease I
MTRDQIEKIYNSYSDSSDPYSRKIIQDSINHIKTHSMRRLIENIKQSFLDNNSQLKWDNIDLQMKETKLSAVAFCYDLNFKYIECKPNM